jgi:quercetin dioxygenase-like cupin family protein
MAPIPAKAQWDIDGHPGFDFWVLNRLPAALSETMNPPASWEPVNEAPPGGAVGRIVSFPPGYHFGMHATPTLDFVVVLSGEIELGLEAESVVLGPGDVLVQRGTVHRWRVLGDGPCTILDIFFDAGSDASS